MARPGLRFATKDTLQQRIKLPPDYRPTIGADQVSTLLHPSIYTVYREDMRRWRYQ